MSGRWSTQDERDRAVDFVRKWTSKGMISQEQMVTELGLSPSKFHDWVKRYGSKNQHNAPIPRWFWLLESEKEAILEYYEDHPDEGYRRLSYMMLDDDVVAVSPSSVYRVLKKAGKLNRWAKKASGKGKGFTQPQKAHQHWHVDVAYVKLGGTFYYLCTVRDGYSRYVVHWDIRESMKEQDVEIVLQKAKEKFPQARPRIISDNGPQFIAWDFKEFIRISGMTHVRTSFNHPQSNGKLERWHGSLWSECIRPGTPLSIEDARRLVKRYVDYYNNQRLHSALGYITPKDKLEGREEIVFADRERKLKESRQRRRLRKTESSHVDTQALELALVGS